MNFSFLSPIFLIGVAAVALPMIAHLISKKSGLKKKFPAVRFLIASQGETATRSKIKDLVLLALRALIIALIALLFAKPAVFSYSNIASSEPKALAVVIDNSFSMGYGDNFERAVEEARSIIRSYPDGSFFVTASLVKEPSETLTPTQDRASSVRTLEDITLSQSFTDNENRLEEIYSALENAPNEQKKVILITDNQKNGWKSGEFNRSWLSLIDISMEETPGNIAVTNISSGHSKESAAIKVRVSNFSDSEANDLLTKAKLSGHEIKAHLTVEPFDFTSKEFIFTSGTKKDEPSGTGVVSIPEDELLIDNKRHFVLSRAADLSVLIVDGDPREDSRLSESYYLMSAAEAASELLPARIRIIDNESFLDSDLSSYDLIFITNVGDITPKTARALSEFSDSGGTLVIFPGDRVRAGNYNALFKDILPGKLGAPSDIDSTLISDDTDIFSEGLLQDLSQTKIRRAFKLTPAEDAITVLRLKSGDPYLAYKSYGQGNVFLFTSTSDNAWGNFAITPVFAPLIKEYLDFESNSNTSRRNYIVGDSVWIDCPRDAGSIEVQDPLGNKVAVGPREPVFRGTSQSGIYKVLIDGEEYYAFSVNIDPLESNLEKLSVPEIDAGQDSSGTHLVKVFRELWRYFLWGVIALFITESAARALLS